MKERITLRMEVLRDLIQWHEEERNKLADKCDYVCGREDGLIFGYQQELSHLKILLQEVNRNESQQTSAELIDEIGKTIGEIVSICIREGNKNDTQRASAEPVTR